VTSEQRRAGPADAGKGSGTSAARCLDWIDLTPGEGHYLFGYYDRCPFDAGGTRHLALRVPQQERLPQPGERAEVGYIDIPARRFVRLAETEAWNHQQGAMTLWLPERSGCFVFNDFVEQAGEWKPIARVWDAARGRAGEVERYDVPIYTLSRDGRLAASLNFGRIPRRGYSYARAPLPYADPSPNLDGDGLFILDLQTRQARLVASYRQLLAQHPLPHSLEGQYVWLNHAIFNCDGSRVMVLLRHANIEGEVKRWFTHMMTMNVDGSDLRCTLPDVYWRNGAISHQIWGRTPREILVDADWCGRGHEYLVYDETVMPVRATRLSRGMGPMGHLVFSPDGTRIAADTYPDPEGIQRLALVDVKTGEWREIGRFRHALPPGAGVDVRCDLHPRWSADGRRLTVDTIHFGARKVLLLDIEGP